MRRLWGDSNNEFLNKSIVYMGLPGCLSGKESVCQAGDMCLIPGLGRSHGEGNDNPLHGQRGLVSYSSQGCKKLETTKRLDSSSSMFTQQSFCVVALSCTFTICSFFLYVGHVTVTQRCLTLCNPMDYSPPGSSVHGTLQARVLEWVAIPFSRGSS